MTLKNWMIVAVLALGLLAACGEKQKKEAEKEAMEMKAEEERILKMKKDSILKAEKKRADSIKEAIRQDSLRQVKEHGHAH